MKKKKIKKKILNVFHYIVGNFRYRLYYSAFYFLIPIHIREQIEARVASMKPQCYALGSCIGCGCRTTELQMCNKKCDGDCYPRMMNKILWKNMKLGGVYFSRDLKIRWKLKDGKFFKI